MGMKVTAARRIKLARVLGWLKPVSRRRRQQGCFQRLSRLFHGFSSNRKWQHGCRYSLQRRKTARAELITRGAAETSVKLMRQRPERTMMSSHTAAGSWPPALHWSALSRLILSRPCLAHFFFFCFFFFGWGGSLDLMGVTKVGAMLDQWAAVAINT